MEYDYGTVTECGSLIWCVVQCLVEVMVRPHIHLLRTQCMHMYYIMHLHVQYRDVTKSLYCTLVQYSTYRLEETTSTVHL